MEQKGKRTHGHRQQCTGCRVEEGVRGINGCGKNTLKLKFYIQGLAEIRLASVWWVGYVNISHQMDSSLNISLKMSYGVL